MPISGGADPMLEAIQGRQPVAAGANAVAGAPTATGIGGVTSAAPPGSLQAAVDAARARAAAVARARADASGNGIRPGSTGAAAQSGSAQATSGARGGAAEVGMASGGGTGHYAASTAGATAAADRGIRPGGPVGGSADRPAQDADARAAGGPCADARLLADERCELAERARAGATAAEDALRATQRAHDDHQTAADQAAVRADARAIRAAKDEAQARFRSGRGAAITTEEVEAAARAWLVEINAINSAAREATAALTRERDAANDLVIRLERLAIEADAARISAETAEQACLAARQAHADCEEREAAGPRSHPPVLPPVEPQDPEPVRAGPGATLASGGSPRIFRLLRGDRAALAEVAAALGGADPEARRTWQLQIAGLVDAILADSIASASLDFPQEHGFWGPFTRDQDREIVRALSSLGYRFDGLGGWVDGRIPSQRDLSLALGYAGLDPMRMRHWPTEREMADLFADVEVAGAEHLSGAAGDMTLGELVSMLGRRADGLAEVWNHWGRIRPLLLEEA